MNFRLSILILAFCLLSCQTNESQTTSATTDVVLYDGSWESLQQMPIPDWFNDGKIGIFIHWGPYSVNNN